MPFFSSSVTYLPPNLKCSSRGALFYHNGIGVALPGMTSNCLLVSRKSCVTYMKEQEGWLKSYARALGNNFLLRLPFPPLISTIRTLHDLDLHLKRMLFHQEKWGKEVDGDITFEDLFAFEVLGHE